MNPVVLSMVEEGGEGMKRLASLALVVAVAALLSACSTMGKHDAPRVKCPACGYEFQAPAGE